LRDGIQEPRKLPEATETSTCSVALETLSLAYWLDRDLPEPDLLMGEWLGTTSRALIVGPTGLGKTNFGLSLGISVSAGQEFLHWRAGRPSRVLYLDGEMSRRLMKRRLQDAVRRADVKPSGFMVLSKEDAEKMPPLNSAGGQEFIDSLITSHGPLDLIIFDNIQALLEGDMKDEEQWAKVLPWARSLTRQAIGQIWLHHTGHDEGKSYGSKAREWQMDTVALMERADKGDADIAFTLRFTKARERTPDNRADFEPVTMTLIKDRWEHELLEAKPITGAAKIALDHLHRAIADAGQKPPSSNHVPQEIRVVPLSLWRSYCYSGSISQGDTQDARKKAFNRAAQKLQALGKIGVWKDVVWPA
jgi:hypothetical protein